MAHTNGSMPFIKAEPDEYSNDPNRFMSAQQNYRSSQQNFSNPFGTHLGDNSIDPSELSTSNGNFGMPYGFGSQQNMSSSFNMGNAGFGEDELLESLDFNGQQNIMEEFTNQSANQSRNQRYHSSVPVSQMSNLYSRTPDGAPTQSPFLGHFDPHQARPMNSLPQHMSAHHTPGFASMKRPSLPVNRKSSDQRIPMTPRTAAMSSLHIGTPESASYPNGRPIRTPSLQNRHQKTLSGQYDSTPGSLHSYIDSPISSPGHPSHHTGISETIISGKHASMPTKVEMDAHNESTEAKKRRRRASHNAVERRRRDNINERIQDLSHLVPQHRLDDDKVKKALQGNSPMSPSIGAQSMSPPNAATSLLAGATGRRAASTAGNITMGLPIEDKEKGPNKGDILNGAVSWTRDLMWALNAKLIQEQELMEYISQLGGTWPFEITEDEKRMRSEVTDAVEKNDARTFGYSRGHGSGLVVPHHTDRMGQPLPGTAGANMSPQSMLELSPGFHSGGSGSGSGGPGQPTYYNSGGYAGMSFKEEDEFMEED